MKALATRLLDSACSFVESALSAYDLDEPHVFLLHAGTSLEHLLKARLAELNPALIAKRDHVPSLIWFADEARHEGPVPVTMRTISLDEALERVTALGVPLNKWRAHLDTLKGYRNGVAHLGIADRAVSYQVLPSFLQVVTLLSQELGHDPQLLFGRYSDFVISQLDQHVSETERVLEGRLAQARMRFKRDHAGMTADARRALRTALELRWQRHSIDQQLIDCPVCGLPAYVDGYLDAVGWDPEYDSEGDVVNASPVVEYNVAEFRCPTCTLVLDTPGLIDASGVMENWELPSDDYYDFVREYAADQMERAWENFK